jgi:hypothetical protein
MIPAKIGDIVKKIDSHYKNEITNGQRFVVLDVDNVDDTAIVSLPSGELGILCFPEEYEVVGKLGNMIQRYNKIEYSGQ